MTINGIDHDVRVYPQARHAFLNDHVQGETPWWALVMGALSRSRYDGPSARDARRRIIGFFDQHLDRRRPPSVREPRT